MKKLFLVAALFCILPNVLWGMEEIKEIDTKDLSSTLDNAIKEGKKQYGMGATCLAYVLVEFEKTRKSKYSKCEWPENGVYDAFKPLFTKLSQFSYTENDANHTSLAKMLDTYLMMYINNEKIVTNTARKEIFAIATDLLKSPIGCSTLKEWVKLSPDIIKSQGKYYDVIDKILVEYINLQEKCDIKKGTSLSLIEHESAFYGLIQECLKNLTIGDYSLCIYYKEDFVMLKSLLIEAKIEPRLAYLEADETLKELEKNKINLQIATKRISNILQKRGDYGLIGDTFREYCADKLVEKYYAKLTYFDRVMEAIVSLADENNTFHGELEESVISTWLVKCPQLPFANKRNNEPPVITYVFHWYINNITEAKPVDFTFLTLVYNAWQKGNEEDKNRTYVCTSDKLSACKDKTLTLDEHMKYLMEWEKTNGSNQFTTWFQNVNIKKYKITVNMSADHSSFFFLNTLLGGLLRYCNFSKWISVPTVIGLNVLYAVYFSQPYGDKKMDDGKIHQKQELPPHGLKHLCLAGTGLYVGSKVTDYALRYLRNRTPA